MKPSLELRHVALRVADLPRSLAFYRDQLGFVVTTSTATTAELATVSTGTRLLTLHEDREAAPASPLAAGLFHAALVFPDRAALGAWLRHAAEHDVAFDGFSDHGVSEALYFTDPDGNGLEFYADHPRDRWPMRGAQVEMVTQPLDIESLLGAGQSPGPDPLAGAHWGHLHLRVTDLERSEAFYREHLGVAVMQRTYPGARFLAADGYHHHLGLNVWGHPREPRSSTALGLVTATFARRGETAPRTFSDPDHIGIIVTP